MADCDLTLELDQEGPHVSGDALKGRLVVRAKGEVRFDSSKVTLEYATSGRGAVDKGSEVVPAIEPMHLADGETASIPFEFVVPEAPITMRGHILAVAWVLRAEIAVPWAFDPSVEREIVVVPKPREAAAGVGYRDPPRRAVDDRDASDRGTSVAMVRISKGAAVVVGLFGVFAVYMILHWRSRNPATGNFHFVQLAIVIVLVLFTIWKLVGRRLLNHLAERGLGAPHVEVGPSSVPRGEAFDVSVTLAPPGALELAQVQAKLRCTEKASSGSGNNRTTRSHVAYVESLVLAEGVTIAGGTPRTIKGKLRVPPSALPSLDLSNNDVQWHIEVSIRKKGSVDHVTETAVHVVA